MNGFSKIINNKRKKTIWRKIVYMMAAIVVFVTTYMLILPAITMESDPICGYEEHTHSDSCYSVNKILVCGVEETEGHKHSDECLEVSQVLVCLDESEEHEHVDTCYTTEEALICTVVETEGHTHSDECYETGEKTLNCSKVEHTHTDSCYPKADEETAAEWEETFADIELTGNWSKDVLEIAKSQLGYSESTKNYITTEDGTKKGYTRYGDWYGDAYGDWCAMYTSFCLHYAEVDTDIFPLEANCQRWIDILSSDDYNLYYLANEYNPRPGDLIFFNNDSDDNSDHIGFVVEIIEATETDKAKVKTIEGNSSDQVKYNSYDLDDEEIMGYGKLPINPDKLTEDEIKEVEEVISLIDDLPTADEFDAKLEEYEEKEDYTGYEEYYIEMKTKIVSVYKAYSQLTDIQKEYVVNADKILEFEYVWSQEVLIDEISSDAVDKNDIATYSDEDSTKDFIELNLYDYGSNINTKYNSNNEYPGFQWNGGAYARSDKTWYLNNYGYTSNRNLIDSIDFGNSVITDLTYGSSSSGTNGKSNNAKIVGKSDGSNGAINALDVSSYGTTNRPIGMSLNSSITSTTSDVLSRTLGSDGYPALKNGTSLSYLFENGTYAKKKNTKADENGNTSIDLLFRKNDTTGAYEYNSRLNHAQYNSSTNTFDVYNQIITPNFITYPFGNFLPLNDITSGDTSTQVSKITSMSNYIDNLISDLKASTSIDTATKNQLATMLDYYKTNVQYYGINGKKWSTFSSKDAIIDYFKGDQTGDNPSDDTSLITDSLLQKMYNIDWDVASNFFFGMDMEMNFMQPKDGLTGNDTNKDGTADYPMKFYFTGDDDVWVYIDGVLFLDLSGIHRHVGGEIDFVNGKVYYYYLDTEKTGDVSEVPYKTYTFKEILSAAGKSTDGLNSKGTFKDYTTHNFKFYYMERGSGSSVCRLNFNFPLLRKNSISVNKQLSQDNDSVDILGNPDFYFQVLQGNTVFSANKEYKVYDSKNDLIATRTADSDGIFYIKADQTAVFENVIAENAGKYVVKELLEDGTVVEGNNQYAQITVNGTVITEVDQVEGTLKETFDGAVSTEQDASSGSATFEFNNKVNTSYLGKIELSKVLSADSSSTDNEFTFVVTLNDNTLLPKDTSYTVTYVDENGKTITENKTVSTAGEINIKADQTATISNILAGTKYNIYEKSTSSEGYIVKYIDLATNEIIPQDNSSINGKIKASIAIGIQVENKEAQGSINIPFIKNIDIFDEKERTFNFVMEEVELKDSSWVPVNNGYSSNLDVTYSSESIGNTFTIPYLYSKVSNNQTLFYKVYETLGNDSTVAYDSNYYIIEIKITKNASDKTVIPTIISCKQYDKDGNVINENVTLDDDSLLPFNNSLVGELQITKELIGSSLNNESFNMIVKVIDSKNNPITGEFNATKISADNTSSDENIEFDSNGESIISLKQGESIIIHSLPYKASWKVTEVKDEDFGYDVLYKNGDNTSDNDYSYGVIETTLNTSTVVNNTKYVLPYTGGSGTYLYTICGISLMVMAFIAYRILQRKNEVI